MSLLNSARPDGRHEAGRRPGRPAVPQRQAGQRLPRSPRRRRRRSRAPLTVLSTRPAPPSTDVYNQTIPSSGYGYLTTRDGTKLAIDVHPPQDVTNVAAGGLPLPARRRPARRPTLIEYSGYGYADPAGPAERDRDPRQPDGLHGRRRQHARHRLLGRRLRLLRAAAEPRRLRRDRDDRPPAVGRCTTRSG